MVEHKNSGNYWMRRCDDDAKAERLAETIRQVDRRESITWAIQIIAVWLLGMTIVYYKTIYAATIQGSGSMAGLSAAIVMGVIVTAMIFAVWYRNR